MFHNKSSLASMMLALALSLIVSANATASSTPVLVEGDILQADVNQRRAITDSRLSRIWPNGVIPYVVSPELSAHAQSRVTEAVAHWNERTGITLREIDALAAVRPADYVEFTSGPGCASWVGRQGGRQDIWVADDCSSGSLIHEIGHAVGFEHEHTRPDRDQFITILWENIAEDKVHNFDIPSHRVMTPGEYDYESIMHYGEAFFSSNGMATIVANTELPVDIGQRLALSAGDIAAVEQMYASDLSLSSLQTPVGDQLELSLQVSNQSEQGAHDLVVSVPSEGRQIVGQSDNDWQCEAGDSLVQCRLPELAGLADSTVVITFAASDVLASNFTLTSKTPDLNQANNGEPSAQQQIAASDAAQLSGAGSLAWSLLILIPIAARRVRQA